MIKYFLSHKIRPLDAVFVVLAALFTVVYGLYRVPFSEATVRTQELTLGYLARESGGDFYALDDGHSRLIRFDTDGNILFQIKDPSDNGESVFYIDDFLVDGESVYLSVSEWNGMLLDRELIVRYNQNAEYQETVTDRDYTRGEYINKHRFYGLCMCEGELTFAECLDNCIYIHRGEKIDILSCENAFNAVSDIVFDGKTPVVLLKNGEILRYEEETPRKVYSTGWPGEEERIPFRMAVHSGYVYMTDIRGNCVVEIDSASQTVRTVYENIDSQTVSFSDTGHMLLFASDGLHVVSPEGEQHYLVLQKSIKTLMQQRLFLVDCGFLVIVLIILLIRIVALRRAHRHSGQGSFGLLLVITALIVGTVISFVLLSSFRNTYLDKIREQLKSTAFITATSIDWEDLGRVRQASDFGGEAYTRLCDTMERIFPMNVDFFRTTYCNILRLDENHEYGWGLAYLDQSIGVYFPLDEVETAEVQEVYRTAELVWNDAVADVTGTYLSVKVPVQDSEGHVVGAVAVGADTFVVDEMLDSMQRSVLLSIVVIILLLWVMSTELAAFSSNTAAYEQALKEKGKKAIPNHMIRIMIFAVFAAFNMVSSFLPVFILRRSTQIPEGIRDLAASFPMAINIFVMGIMSLFCASAVRKLGIRRVFILSTAFSLCGNLILRFLPGYGAILLGLLLDGMGVGLITNTIYVMLTFLPDEDSRQGALSIYNTASLSGINFGMIMGGLLAVWAGQRNVFLIVSSIWLFMMALGVHLSRTLESVLVPADLSMEEEKLNARQFVRNKAVWSFFALVQNPYILFNSFAFFFVPIFCEGIGYNEAIVSILLMLYSEVAVLLGDYMTEKMDHVLGQRAIYLAMALNIGALAVFAFNWNINGLVIALLLLGLSASFGKPLQQTWYLRQKPVIRYGEDRAMGVYNFSENIGESLGPIVFSRLMTGAASTIVAFLGVVTALSGIHLVMNRREVEKDG